MSTHSGKGYYRTLISNITVRVNSKLRTSERSAARPSWNEILTLVAQRRPRGSLALSAREFPSYGNRAECVPGLRVRKARAAEECCSGQRARGGVTS